MERNRSIKRKRTLRRRVGDSNCGHCIIPITVISSLNHARAANCTRVLYTWTDIAVARSSVDVAAVHIRPRRDADQASRCIFSRLLHELFRS